MPTGGGHAAALAVLASIVVLPGALNAFTLPKLCASAAVAAFAIPRRRAWRFSRPVVICLAAAAVSLALAMALSEHPLLAVVGPEPRYPGIVSLLPYAGVALVGAALVAGDAPRSFVPALAVAAGLVAAVSLLEHVGLSLLDSDVARPGSLLGNASDQGQWGLLVLGPLLVLSATRRTPWVVTGAALAGAVVALSGSRAALLGELAIGVAALVLRFRRRGWLLAAGAALALALAALVVPGVAARVGGSSPLAEHTAHGRTLLWQETLDLTADHPLGVAPGGFLDTIPAEHDSRWELEVGPSTPPGSPESVPLELLAVGGPVLLLSGLGLAGLVAAAAWRRRADPLAAGLAVGLTGYATASLFAAVSPGPAVLAALFAGALLAVPRPARQDPPWPRWVLGTAAVILLLACAAEIPLRTGLLDIQSGRFAAADSAFGTARALRPWDPSLPVQAGHGFAAAAQSGRAEAAGRCSTWLRRAPATLAVLADEALCAESRGELSQASELLAQAARRDPVNPLLALRQGVLAAEQQKYGPAESWFLRAASLAPRSPDPWRDLAQLYQLTGRQADRAAALARAANRS